MNAGIYSVLFYQSVQVLLSRRTPNYKLHLGWMTTLFLLSTIHIALAYAWAFITDTADTAIYELFSLSNPLPVLYLPGDPPSVHRIGILLKIRYNRFSCCPSEDTNQRTDFLQVYARKVSLLVRSP
jgi:hypothetical protein